MKMISILFLRKLSFGVKIFIILLVHSLLYVLNILGFYNKEKKEVVFKLKN